MSRMHRALVGAVAAGLLSLPLVSAGTAAPKKPSKGKPAKGKPAPKKPAPKPDAAAGKTAFRAEGCAGCHATKEFPDGKLGPDLSEIGKEHTAAQISAYIKQPKAGSVMPAFKGPQGTLENITAYMLTQK